VPPTDPSPLVVPFGAGIVRLHRGDGAVIAVEHPERPGMTYLLDETTEPWHTAERRWGKGFVITDRGGARWDAATRPEIVTGPDGARVTATHPLGDGLVLDVERRFGTTWAERYSLRCTGPHGVAIRTLGIYTPWRDVYASAADALAHAVHAHVWPGGGHAFTLAQPMDGGGPVLGLRVRAGELWAYSIESREALVTGSNVRGHVVLHVTDAARARHAFGGQPEVGLRPGEAYVLEWELDWYESVAAFARRHPPPVELDALAAATGERIPFRRRDASVRVHAAAPVSVAGDGLCCSQEGEAYVEVEADGRRSRVAVSWHAPLDEVVRRRVRFMLAHQRARHRAGAAAGAFLPFDTEHRLPVLAGGWADFSDGRERIGMGLLLHEALARGWVDDPAEAHEAAAAYRRFVVDFIVTGDDGLRADSHRPAASDRLYDLPWVVLLLAAHDTDRALRLFRAYYARGGADFLAIGIGVAAQLLVRVLRAAGRDNDAGEVLRLIRSHAARCVEARADLAAHEVNYEQSMVAPLLEVLCVAASLTDDAAEARTLDAAIVERLPWLLAFGGPQPHVRMRDIAIRHWDGYWFGREQLWGDVFPHYWSVLTANVLLLLPPAAAAAVERDRGVPAQRLAAQIYAANLIDFQPDGRATAAFVMPSCVSGRPAHRADAIANDQDWALFWPLHLGL
jgi:hypothetical protein